MSRMAHLWAHCLLLAVSSAEAIHQNPDTWNLHVEGASYGLVARLPKAALKESRITTSQRGAARLLVMTLSWKPPVSSPPHPVGQTTVRVGLGLQGRTSRLPSQGRAAVFNV